MRVEGPAINSTYPQVSKATAARLDGEYKVAATAVTTANVNEGLPSTHRNPLVLARRAKGEEIKTELARCMTQVEANFRQHEQNMNALAARAKQVLQLAQRLADNAGGSTDPTTLSDAARGTATAAMELGHIAANATADSKAFFNSWNDYRQLSLPNTPDEYKADYIEARQRVMQAMKMDTAKLKKLSQLTERADYFHKLSAQMLNTSKREKGQAQADADKLAKDLDALWDKTMAQTNKIGLHSVVSKAKMLDLKTKAAKIDKKEGSTLEGVYKDMEATVKQYKTTVKTMTTLYNTALKGLSPKEQKDKAVAASLSKAKQILDAANKGLADSTKLFVDAGRDIIVIRTKVK